MSDDDLYDDDPWGGDEAPCLECDGEGLKIMCIDDMCRGSYQGDGICPLHRGYSSSCFSVCGECKGEGVIRIENDGGST